MKKIVLLSLSLTLFATGHAMADENSPAPPSSWSIDLLGGATFGNFTFDSEITPHAGLRFRYALNPVVSLYGQAGGGMFRSVDDLADNASFENTYLTYGLGTRVNILRMVTGPNERFGIYGQMGMSVIKNSVETGDSWTNYPAQDYSGNALLYQLGAGATFRLSRRVDFFVQGEVNYSNSELLDGYERMPGVKANSFAGGGDAFINTSAGIAVKLGSRDVRHADWYRRDHRIDPLAQSHQETLQQMETRMAMTDTATDTLYERIQMFERTLNDLTEVLTQVHADQLMNHYNRIESLQNHIDMLQSEINELSEKMETRAAVREDQPHRYFVVSGVFRNPDYAEAHLRELRNQGYEHADMFRDRSRNYYLVNYSGFASESDANEKLDQIRSEINPDSWIYVR